MPSYLGMLLEFTYEAKPDDFPRVNDTIEGLRIHAAVSTSDGSGHFLTLADSDRVSSPEDPAEMVPRRSPGEQLALIRAAVESSPRIARWLREASMAQVSIGYDNFVKIGVQLFALGPDELSWLAQHRIGLDVWLYRDDSDEMMQKLEELIQASEADLEDDDSAED